MSRKLMFAPPAATAVVAVSLIAGSAAFAENISDARRDCTGRIQQCGDLAGSRLNSCLLSNGKIEHACNYIIKWSKLNGGCTAECKRAQQVLGHAAKANEADLD